MTVAQLDDVILAADAERCIRLFEGMPETRRKELAHRARQWASVLNAFSIKDRPHVTMFAGDREKEDLRFYQDMVERKEDFPCGFNEGSVPVARIAVLATLDFPNLKKVGNMGLPAPGAAVEILRSRKPTWLPKWCAYVLREAPASHFLAVYGVEKAGLLTVERDAPYWLAMVCSLANDKEILATLRNDESLRGMIWQMLDDQGVMRMLSEPEEIAHQTFRRRWTTGGNIFAIDPQGTRHGSDVWRETLLKLAAEKLINRDRLVEYSFRALAGAAEKEAKKSYYQDVSTAGFAIELSRELTSTCREEYIAQFTSLIGATHKDVSTYAAKVLTEAREDSLLVQDIASGIAPAFLNKSKEPAEAALKLIARLAKLQPGAQAAYGEAILAAFGHRSKDIHKKALALVESTKLLEDETLRAEFQQRLDMLGGMERSQAVKLLSRYAGDSCTNRGMALAAEGGAAGVSSTSSTANAGALSSGVVSSMSLGDIDNLVARADKVAKHLSAQAGLDEAIVAAKKGICLDEPVTLRSLDFPRLNPDKRLGSIETLDDLIFNFLKVWSGKCDALELELILDGISRLLDQRPPDFNEKMEVIRRKTIPDNAELGVAGGSMAHLASMWLTGKPLFQNDHFALGAREFFDRRVIAIAKRAVEGQAAPLLAAPTHQDGWIEPKELVSRLARYRWLKLEPDKADFIQALLRLAPDNRKEARDSAADIQGEIGEALRYALGEGAMGKVSTPEYWVAAFRAREPYGSSPELARKLPNCGPDGPDNAVYRLDLEAVDDFCRDAYPFARNSLPNFLSVESADSEFPVYKGRALLGSAFANPHQAAARKYLYYPTILLHDISITWLSSGVEAYIWLNNRESLFALYGKRMLQHINSAGNYWHGHFEPLFDPDVSLAENGRYVLCFMMSSKNNDLSRLAVDVLIAAVSERRIVSIRRTPNMLKRIHFLDPCQRWPIEVRRIRIVECQRASKAQLCAIRDANHRDATTRLRN